MGKQIHSLLVGVVVITALSVAPPPLQAQSIVELAPMKTDRGCTVRVDPSYANLGSSGLKVTITWDGACVGGLAQGLGTLRIRMSNDAVDSSVTTRQTAFAGYPIGYQSTKAELGPMAPAMEPGLLFMHEGRSVGFTDGWGLSTEGLDIGDSTVAQPRSVPVAPKPGLSIHSPSLSAMFQAFDCSHADHRGKVPTCEGNLSRRVHVVTLVQQGGNPLANYRNRRQLYCPDPHSLASCAGLIEEVGAPLRAEVLAFIEAAKPAVDRMLATVVAPTPASAGASPAAGGAPLATGAASAGDLETLPVGALFARADEASARGDKAAARAALRALIRRFPDHALAATAAQTLSQP